MSLLDKRGVAAMAGVSPRTVSRLVKEGVLPVIRIGYRTLRFNGDEVVKALQYRLGR
jgi:excisionase family DNA binding protein